MELSELIAAIQKQVDKTDFGPTIITISDPGNIAAKKKIAQQIPVQLVMLVLEEILKVKLQDRRAMSVNEVINELLKNEERRVET